MWAKEKEVQKETIKDLPKMNQVGPIRTPKRVWTLPPSLHPWNGGILLPTFRPTSQRQSGTAWEDRGRLFQGLVQNTPSVLT